MEYKYLNCQSGYNKQLVDVQAANKMAAIIDQLALLSGLVVL